MQRPRDSLESTRRDTAREQGVSMPASELLQDAVRAELHRQGLLEETDRYVAQLIDQAGCATTALPAPTSCPRDRSH